MVASKASQGLAATKLVGGMDRVSISKSGMILLVVIQLSDALLLKAYSRASNGFVE